MPRKPRNCFKSHFFHVITQGINKSYIFDSDIDIKCYLKYMYKYKDEQKINIIAYCIMNNHAHILIEVENIENLSKYMQKINTMYARYYNKKYNKVGYVFRDRFKSEIICNENHYYNCIRYIFQNPIKAGICNNIEDYLYSNYKTFLLKEKLPKDNSNNSFIDIEDEFENNYKDFIKDFLKENKIENKDIKKNNVLLKKLILILKNDYGLSLRKISKIMNISREKIRRIYNL